MATPTAGRTASLTILTLVLGVASPGALAQPADVAPERAFHTANGLLNRGLFDLALPEYQAFLQGAAASDERRDVARYGAAVCLSRLGRPAEAAPLLEGLAGVEGFRFEADVLLLLGHARLQAGDAPGAAAALARLIEGHRGHASIGEARVLHVEALHRAGRHADVPAAARRAVRTAGDGLDRLELFWGLSAAAMGRHEQAAELFGRVVERARPSAERRHATLGLAQALHAVGREGAAARYRAVLASNDPALAPRAAYGLAGLLHERGDLRAAAALLDPLLDPLLDQGGDGADAGVAPLARLLRARIAVAEGDHRLARRLLEPLAAGDDAAWHDDAAYWQAKSLLRSGDHELAARAFGDAAEGFPESELVAEMRYDRAVALSRSGETRAAEAAFAAFLERHPDHARAATAAITRANLLHDVGDYAASEAVLADLGRPANDDHRASAAFLGAENAYLMGDTDRAERAYRRFVEAHADHEWAPTARFRIGMCLYRQARMDEAEPFLVEAASSDDPALALSALVLGDIHLRREQWVDAERRLSSYLAGGAEAASAADALLKLGVARARQGDHEGAASAFARVRDDHPEAPGVERATFELGQSLVALERWDEAAAVLTELTERWASSAFLPAAQRHLGALAQRRGDLEEAAQWFGVAARGGGGVAVRALVDRGRAELALGRFDDAAATLGRVLEDVEDPDLAAQARAVRAIALARGERFGEALSEIDRVLRSGTPGVPTATRDYLTYQRGRALEALERPADAAGAFAALVESSGASADLRAHAGLSLAAIEMDRDRHDAAAAVLDRVREGFDQLTAQTRAELGEQLAYRRGVCAHELGDLEGVVAALDGFASSWPGSEVAASAELVCAEALIGLGRHRAAATKLESIAGPESPDGVASSALLRLGEAQAALQRWARSEAAFGAFLERFGDEHELWFSARFGLGWARENQGRRAEAIEAYREVIGRHNGATAARAQFQIGECLYADRRYDDAIREFLRVDILYAHPEWSAAALYEAGRCFEETGRRAEARAQFTAVVERFDGGRWAEMAGERLAALAQSAPPGRGAATP